MQPNQSYRWLRLLPWFASGRGVESLKVTGRSSSIGPCRMSLLTHGGLFNTRALLFLYHLRCDGILAGVESVPEAALLTLCIVPFYEGQSPGRHFPPLLIIEQTAFLPMSTDILCWLSKNFTQLLQQRTLFSSHIHNPHFSNPVSSSAAPPFGFLSAFLVVK